MTISHRSPKRSTERSAGSENVFSRFAKRWRLLVLFFPFCIVLFTAKTLLSEQGTFAEVFGHIRTVPTSTLGVPAPTPTYIPLRCHYEVTAFVLHARSCPGTYCSLRYYLYKGEVVVATKHEAGWARLEDGSWVNEEYIEMICGN